MFHATSINQMCTIFKKRPTNAHGCMNVILLRNNHWNVLTTHVAILRVVRKRVQVQIVSLLNAK